MRFKALALLGLVVAMTAVGSPSNAHPLKLTVTADRTTVSAFPAEDNWASLTVYVTDENDMPVDNAIVAFTFTKTQSSIPGISLTSARTSSRTVTTGEDGYAYALYYAGGQKGTDEIEVSAATASALIEFTVLRQTCKATNGAVCR